MTRRVEVTAILSTSQGDELVEQLRAKYAQPGEGVYALGVRYIDTDEPQP